MFWLPPELLTPAHHAPRRPSQHPSALRQLLLLLPLPPPSPPPPPPPLLLPPLLCTISSSPPSRWCTWSTSARRTTSARKTSGCPSCSSGCRWVLGLALGLRGCHSTLAGSVVLSTAAQASQTSRSRSCQPGPAAWSLDPLGCCRPASALLPPPHPALPAAPPSSHAHTHPPGARRRPAHPLQRRPGGQAAGHARGRAGGVLQGGTTARGTGGTVLLRSGGRHGVGGPEAQSSDQLAKQTDRSVSPPRPSH